MTPRLSHVSAPPAGWLSRAVAGALIALITALATACSEKSGQNDQANHSAPFEWPKGPHPRVALEIEDRGQIVLELYPELAPQSVARFLQWVSAGHYAGKIFHRVIPEFMIQAGGSPQRSPHGPVHDPTQPAFEVPDEFNRAPHVRGTLSLANRGSPDSANGEFFILQGSAPHLDGRHTGFGRVVEGLDRVDTIAAVEIDTLGRWGQKNRPLEDILIRRAYVLRDDRGASLGPLGSETPEPSIHEPQIASGS